MKWLIHIDNI